LRDDHLHPAGQTIGIPNLGWYAFQHTYRTLLDDLGTPIGVQQKLMRHSDVRTTMNHYGSAYEKTKRRANTFGGRQTAAREHDSGIKNNDLLTETNGIEQGNEIRSLAILTIQCK
jgi:hypothetical protein